MIRLVYTSTANKDWKTEDLLKLLKQSRKNNSIHDITGILLYSNRTFFQVLEGDEAAINELFRIIEADQRHKDITILEKKAILVREFPYWNMGFQKIDDQAFKEVAGLQDFFENDFNPAGFLAHKSVISPLMKLIRGKLEQQVQIGVHEELPVKHDDPFVQTLHRIIRFGVKFLALVMVIVMILGGAELVYEIYLKVISPPFFMLKTSDMLVIFGGFLVILIAIEIFLNITLYIRSDVIPVKLVVATALMAISRKIIVFDYKELPAEYVTASGWVVVGLGLTYWLIQRKEP